jgi:hypothetical protein
VEAPCQGIVRDEGVRLWVGGEEEAIGGRHALIGGVVRCCRGGEVAGSEPSPFALLLPFM